MMWVFLALSWASVVPEVSACLAMDDVDCARAALGPVQEDEPNAVQAARARTAFYGGEYAEAYDLLKSAVDHGWPDRQEQLELYERTMYATSNWVEVKRGHFAVRYLPGLDSILVEDAFSALQRAEKNIAPLVGGPPPGVTRVEIFPDARSFIAASSLMSEDVRTTGIVGLSKWSRLLITSPRARPRGYDWLDTIGHEYIHLVIKHQTHDHAPVWLHEAIAKFLDNRWRDGTNNFRLTVRQQGLIADAIKNDDFVAFADMHPSLAKLPTAERASLAYAQLSTLMAHGFDHAGEDLLLSLIPRIRAGEDPFVALADCAGFASFSEMEASWKESLKELELVNRKLAELPVVLDGGDELDADPVFNHRKDLARFLTLGDLLRDHNKPEAALIEYHKALIPDEPASPLLANRIAAIHLSQSEPQRALAVLRLTLADYPEFALTHKNLGAVALKRGRLQQAIGHLNTAIEINPFDPEVRTWLIDTLRKTGNSTLADHHQQLLFIRNRGGESSPPPPIHDREGVFLVPSYADKPGGEAGGLIGNPAPVVEATTLDGATIRLSDFAGQVVVVDFWATWCGPCKQAMPKISELAEQHQGVVQVIGLTDEAKTKVKAFMKTHPVSYTIAIDSGRANRRFGVSSLPTVVVINKQGVVTAVIVGAGAKAHSQLKQAVADAL